MIGENYDSAGRNMGLPSCREKYSLSVVLTGSFGGSSNRAVGELRASSWKAVHSRHLESANDFVRCSRNIPPPKPSERAAVM